MSELVARHLRPYNLNIAHKPTESLRKTLVHVKDPLPMQRRWNVVYSIPCSGCPSAYVGQTGRQFTTRMKEHQSAVRRQDKNSLLALHYLTTGHAFDWTRASVVGKELGSSLRPGKQRRRVLTRAIKPCEHIGNASARNHKPSAAPLPPSTPLMFFVP